MIPCTFTSLQAIMGLGHGSHTCFPSMPCQYAANVCQICKAMLGDTLGSVATSPTLHGAPSHALHTLPQGMQHLHLLGTPSQGCPHPQVPQISRSRKKKLVSNGSKCHETPSPNFWHHSKRRKIVPVFKQRQHRFLDLPRCFPDFGCGFGVCRTWPQSGFRGDWVHGSLVTHVKGEETPLKALL